MEHVDRGSGGGHRRMTPAFDAIAPHPDGVDAEDELIHERSYVVRAYRNGDEGIILRGAVRDQKPPGLYIVDATEPLTVHHMIVDLTIAMPSLEITAAKAVMEVHPHTSCPRIEDHYVNLVGLSISRGFTHKVRELFGGPRGGTHTTALLQAMAPVAIQCFWSMAASDAARRSESGEPSEQSTVDLRRGQWKQNLNTCHEWAEDGELVAALRDGGTVAPPLPIRRRAAELGIET